MYGKWDVSNQIDWDEFVSGEQLTFVRCFDHSQGDYEVCIHGFVNDRGQFFILGNEVIKKGDEDESA